ncbi:MAG: hypothetical protein ACKVTZ_02140 [Bacteroidia bacterium]
MKERTDEWVYFLKNSEIKEGFKAKGMNEAKQVLKIESMSDEDKAAYKRFKENRRNEASTLDTAKENAERAAYIQVAKALLKEGISPDLIAKTTNLLLAEIEKLANGEELDVEE